jgi:eukaryotic-like serine/threonine-protein kinase
VLGTADYMAPEQADGKQITSRCDLYALGSVLFALLTGKPPFGGRSLVQVITALKSETPPSVRRLAPDTPAEFENIINQLLEKEPQKRIPTARALANRLKAMEHGLSLETRVAKAGTEVETPEALPALPGPVTIASAKTAVAPATDATVAMEKGDDEYRLAPDMPTIATSSGKSPSNRTAMGTQAGKATGSDSGRGTDATPARSDSATVAPPAKTTRFTTVDARELHARNEHDDGRFWQWAGLAILGAVAILFMGGVVYYATRSPSADQLFATIQQAADSGDDTAIAEVEPQLAQFLARHASDPRAAEVKGYQDELERSRVQRRFELRARRAGGPEGLSPIERAYFEAVQLAARDPEAALARFEALVDVYGGSFQGNERSAEQRNGVQCLELAAQQVARLRPAIEKMNAAEQEEVRRQLARAEQLGASNPAAAQRIWQGIVTLYAGKAWAKELVAQAQEKLAAH